MSLWQGLQIALPRLLDRRLLYKPDIFSILGVYARNSYGLKPTILEANI